MALDSTSEKFILHWGEMGARWGINRTVAQIQALLLVSDVPLTAEDIAATLHVARSNVSTSIRELEGWGLVRPVHVLGDRRRHYESLKDMWEMFRIIVDQRKRREIDPTLEVLRLCITELKQAGAGERYTRERLQELLEFFTEIDIIYRDIRELPLPVLRSTIKARGTVRKLLGLKGQK